MSPPQFAWRSHGRLMVFSIPLLVGCEMPIDPAVQTKLVAERSEQTQFVGAGRCLGCHGKPIDSSNETWKTAFSKFMRDDPHGHAYQVLQEPAARQMVHTLDPTIDILDETKYRGYLSKHCTTCHATPAQRTTHASNGVGCESCHGGAKAWIDKHTRQSWGESHVAEWNRLGFRDLTDTFIIAETCIGCHVGQAPSNGSSVREVTHDLIAAGHPALRFDFPSYFSALPKHWNDAKPTTTWNQWTIGRLVSAEAYLDLLEYRLAKSKMDPATSYALEFSEFDCFGCHRGIGNSAADNDSSGELRWAVWIRGANTLAGIDSAEWNELDKALSSTTLDYAQVHSWIESLRKTIDQRASEIRHSEFSLPEWIDFFRDDPSSIESELSTELSSWEGLTQWVLALNAWLNSRPAHRNERQVRESVNNFMSELNFSSEYNSPLEFDRKRLTERRTKLMRQLSEFDHPNDSGN